MHKSKKETKGGRHDPILTHSEGGHKAGGPNGGGWGGFSFGWMGLAQEENLKIGIEILRFFVSPPQKLDHS